MGFGFDLSLKKVDLFNIFLMLKGKESLHVVSLQLEDLFVFRVGQNEKLVLLSLYLILELNIIVGGLHECHSQVLGNNDVHDVYLFNDNTICVELVLELFLQDGGQLSLDISNSNDLDLFDEISNSFITLLLKQLFKSVWTKVVEEFLAVVFLGPFSLSNVEVDTNIKGNSDVILGWNVLNWALKSDSVHGDHDCNLLVRAEAWVAAWFHNTHIFAPGLLK
jgi:hypothetical protein